MSKTREPPPNQPKSSEQESAPEGYFPDLPDEYYDQLAAQEAKREKHALPGIPGASAIASSVFELVRNLGSLFGPNDTETIAYASQLLIKYCFDNGVLSPDFDSSRFGTPEIAAFLQAHLSQPTLIQAATRARGADVLRDHRTWFHPCIHVSSSYAMYSFPFVPIARGHESKNRKPILMALDSDQRIYPIEKEAHRFVQSVPLLQTKIAQQPLSVTYNLENLADPSCWQGAIDFITAFDLTALPVDQTVDSQRLKTWCLSTFLYPLAETTPILRVLVPDLRTARQMEIFLERMCFHPFVVHRDDQAMMVKNHRNIYAGTTVIGPVNATKGLPKFASKLIASPPVSHRKEPPIAVIEIATSASAHTSAEQNGEPFDNHENQEPQGASDTILSISDLTENDAIALHVFNSLVNEIGSDIPVAGVDIPLSWVVTVKLNERLVSAPEGWGYRPCAIALKAAASSAV